MALQSVKDRIDDILDFRVGKYLSRDEVGDVRDAILAELAEPSEASIKSAFAQMPQTGAIDPVDFHKAMIRHIRDGGS